MMSNRTQDHNGFMTVENCILTSEAVDDYLGSEIPNWQELGLDPNTIYGVYRPIDEIEKAQNEWNTKPLLPTHLRVTATNPRNDLILGVVGANPSIKDTKLYNDITIYDGQAIDNLDSVRDLSIGYDYEPVLENGTFGGKSYQVRMTNIKGNHLALVEDGRNQAAIVADSNDNVKTWSNKTMKILKYFSINKKLVGDSNEDVAKMVLEAKNGGMSDDDIIAKVSEMDKPEPVSGKSVGDDEGQVQAPQTAQADTSIDAQILEALNKINSKLDALAGDNDDVTGDDTEVTGDEGDDGKKEITGDNAIKLARRLAGSITGDSKNGFIVLSKTLNGLGYDVTGASNAELIGMGKVAIKHNSKANSNSITGDNNSTGKYNNLKALGLM